MGAPDVWAVGTVDRLHWWYNGVPGPVKDLPRRVEHVSPGCAPTARLVSRDLQLAARPFRSPNHLLPRTLFFEVRHGCVP